MDHAAALLLIDSLADDTEAMILIVEMAEALARRRLEESPAAA